MRARRLISDICFVPRGGIQKRRTVMHYLAAAGRPIDTSYFEGDGYIHYENEAPKQAKPVARWIRSYAKPGRVLEVGCAYGYLLEALQRQGWDVWGGDVCSAAVEKASGRVGKERLRTWDAEQEPCPFGGQFDALVLNDVVEHFHEPARALSRLCRLVKAGGEVFIRTANFASASHALWGDDWEGFFDYSHYGISWTTPENVTSLLKSEGFDILECWTEGFWLMNCDPLCQVVAEAYISLECLGEALNTLMRGDFLRVVARKGCP
jgi:SAM-dependent methyltransferase